MNHIFLTGEKQVGKSTIINKLIDKCKNKGLNVSGIKSVSVLREDVRNVYLMPALCEKPDEIDSKKAGVCINHHITEKNIDVFENYGVELLSKIDESTDLIIIDEIGKMEKEAPRYIKIIMNLLKQDKIQVIGVLQNMAKGELADYIRSTDTIKLIEVTEKNRDKVFNEINGII